MKIINDYLNKIEEIKNDWKNNKNYENEYTDQIWFRGISKADTYKLVPVMYRKPDKAKSEREMTRDFCEMAIPYLEKMVPENSWEWLFVGRHHGLPTRLLDWTLGSLIALFFAVKEFKEAEDGKVWILNPRSLNLLTKDHSGKDFKKRYRSLNNSIPVSKSEMLKVYLLPHYSEDFEVNKPRRTLTTIKAKFPYAIRSSHVDGRLVAQKGVFTVHGSEQIGLEDLKVKNSFYSNLKLESVIIPADKKKPIFFALRDMGISYASLFPDLDGLCNEIKLNFWKDY